MGRNPFPLAMADETSNSRALTVAEAANVIADLPDYASVLAFVGDDDRKGVTEAADLRSAALAGLAPDPTAPRDALRLGLPDGPASKPGKPLEESGQGKVTVRTAWPVDSFEHGLKGVPV